MSVSVHSRTPVSIFPILPRWGTTGHKELAGIQLDCPFPTYPEGFPAEVIASSMPDGAHLVITADHGNDPTTPSTDHTRGRRLGVRKTFADHAASVAAFFDVSYCGPGRSFISPQTKRLS